MATDITALKSMLSDALPLKIDFFKDATSNDEKYILEVSLKKDKYKEARRTYFKNNILNMPQSDSMGLLVKTMNVMMDEMLTSFYGSRMLASRRMRKRSLEDVGI